MTARGIRNNNPGNLSYNTFTAGLGATGVEPDDPSTYGKGRFAVFPTMELGVFALAKNLLNYQDAHGIHTPRQIINRWAPSNENNVSAYLSFFDGVLGCKPDDEFNFHDADFLYWACTAIGEEECGHDEFLHGVSEATLNLGISDALNGRAT